MLYEGFDIYTVEIDENTCHLESYKMDGTEYIGQQGFLKMTENIPQPLSICCTRLTKIRDKFFLGDCNIAKKLSDGYLTSF